MEPPNSEPTQPGGIRRPTLQSRAPSQRLSQAVPPADQPTRAHQPIPEPPPPAPPVSAPEPRPVIPWWAFLALMLACLLVTASLWGFILLTRERGAITAGADVTPTPVFVVITATVTLGPAPEAATPTPQADLPAASPSPAPTEQLQSVIAVGNSVRVQGTEGSGLAVRQGPGTSFTFFLVAQDGEVFVVEDGPRQADGFTWWYLADPADANRSGWAVENFLESVPEN